MDSTAKWNIRIFRGSVINSMTRPYNDRRNKQIMVEVERRERPQKEIASMFNITWENLRQIIYRLRHVTKSNAM